MTTHRTHWAIKDVDLHSVLRDAGFPVHLGGGSELRPVTLDGTTESRARMVVSPSVFQMPTGGKEPDLVALMMPFDDEFKEVHKAIKAACKDVGLRCVRADDIWEESILIQDVVNLIYRSAAVVVDFTGRNPNVMYETGIAHTLGRPVAPVAQSHDDLPFDLAHHRTLKYEQTEAGLQEMRTVLARRLRRMAE